MEHAPTDDMPPRKHDLDAGADCQCADCEVLRACAKAFGIKRDIRTAPVEIRPFILWWREQESATQKPKDMATYSFRSGQYKGTIWGG